MSEPEIDDVLDFNNPVYRFIPKGRHTWRQQGPYLVCKSCDLKHAVNIGPHLVMVGESADGIPQLVKRE